MNTVFKSLLCICLALTMSTKTYGAQEAPHLLRDVRPDLFENDPKHAITIIARPVGGLGSISLVLNGTTTLALVKKEIAEEIGQHPRNIALYWKQNEQEAEKILLVETIQHLYPIKDNLLTSDVDADVKILPRRDRLKTGGAHLFCRLIHKPIEKGAIIRYTPLHDQRRLAHNGHHWTV